MRLLKNSLQGTNVQRAHLGIPGPDGKVGMRSLLQLALFCGLPNKHRQNLKIRSNILNKIKNYQSQEIYSKWSTT
jgi:hypothetical protein